MNDLISRKAVIKIIMPRFKTARKNNSGSLETQRLYSILHSVYGLPIAYDVDRVVEELEKNKKWRYPEAESTKWFNLGLEVAIEVIKKGCTK